MNEKSYRALLDFEAQMKKDYPGQNLCQVNDMSCESPELTLARMRELRAEVEGLEKS